MSPREGDRVSGAGLAGAIPAKPLSEKAYEQATPWLARRPELG
jgi:hypothetical protein